MHFNGTFFFLFLHGFDLNYNLLMMDFTRVHRAQF